ncbi:nuclear transport factor 2 family protein [Saccharospirillum impatiens]|uniref:nuclear transport factor 2 family protein n=1 Tax=Saccharospirillum impatiens TaxID=169438 RepID=UPI0003F6ADCB|nr:nuclear transport factor 2 family protein [Saccharospirillum impatiens]
MKTELTPLDTLLAEQAIHRLVLDAQHALDTKQFGDFAALFTPEGRLYRPTTPEPLIGRDAIVQAYRKNPPNRLNRHLVTNQRVTLVSATEAQSLAYVTLYSSEAGDQESDVFGAPVHRSLVGEYHDRCVLTDAGWRLQERRAVFVLNQPIASQKS